MRPFQELESPLWEEATLRVLEGAGTALHYTEVSDRIVQQGLIHPVGAKPTDQTMVNLLRLLEKGRVAKISRSTFALPDIAKQIIFGTSKEADAGTPDPRRLTVNAYGLYWKRDLVDWEATGPGRLLGSSGGTRVDFAGQTGIYLLNNGNEMVYVGQSRTAKKPSGIYNRLKAHHRDHRRTDRWDTFSWFGFQPVDSFTGVLLQSPETATIGDVIDILEAIIIEGLMPRLNMRRGEGTKEWLEANQYFQVEDTELIRRRFEALAQVGQALR